MRILEFTLIDRWDDQVKDMSMRILELILIDRWDDQEKDTEALI